MTTLRRILILILSATIAAFMLYTAYLLPEDLQREILKSGIEYLAAKIFTLLIPMIAASARFMWNQADREE